MSTRVEQQEKQAAEAERLNQRIEREQRDAKSKDAGREKFGQLLKGKEAAKDSHDKAAKGTKTKAEGEQKGAAAQKSQAEGERKALLARGGSLAGAKLMEQARSFQSVLGKQGDESAKGNQEIVKSRDDGGKQVTSDRQERTRDLDKVEARKENEREEIRAEAREQERPNAAIDGDAGAGAGSGGSGSDSPGVPLPKQNLQVQAAQQTVAHEVKQIPPELLDKLASAVRVGVNAKGQHEFQVDLKGSVLEGATLKVSTQNSKVTLTFTGLDTQTRNLVESSKGDLMRRLGDKGLSLDSLKIELR